MTKRTQKIAILFAAAAVLRSGGSAAALEPKTFAPGSLIIPTDNCWQGDIAQPTPSKEAQIANSAYGPNCASPTSNSAYANGARRVYGLVWHLLQAGVPIYWIINPAKAQAGVGAIDTPDLTIDVSSCSGRNDAVRLVDQSMPASVCGLDALNPINPGNQGLGTNIAACAKYSLSASPPTAIGTYPLGALGSQPTIRYYGGPFVIDSTNAALARDVMAWYFPTGAVATAQTPYNPGFLAANPTDPAGGLTTAGNYIDPGHHPLHWSQYSPSAFVPLYPPFAFSVDISGHNPFPPCSGSLCPFTTWDPLSPSGHVDPFGNLGTPDLNQIDYATVNVHQAEYAFTGNVGQLIDTPIPPIALAAISDPIHLNTFRFYLEEAGLTFGPCAPLPASSGSWLAPAGATYASGPATGSGDLFFDPNNYPFPDDFGAVYASPYSMASASCSEGLATDDANLLTFNLTLPDGGPGTPLPPSQGGGPYGKVLDLIAPEFTAFANLLTTNATGPGCGTPRYSQFWIPHWDATLQTGPTTAGDPLAATMDTTSGTQSCPIANGPTGPSQVVSPTGQCPWNPQLVQSILDDAAIYVAHGGNLLAECIGAASLEDFTFARLLAQYTLAPNPSTVGGTGTAPINQFTSHFMTEWDPLGSMTAYAPSFTYDLLGATAPTAASTATGITYLQTLAASSCMDNPTGPAAVTYLAWTPPSKPATVYNPIGFPGNSVLPITGAGIGPLAAPCAGCVPARPPGGAALSWQVNTNGGTNPDTDGGTASPHTHIVEYAPVPATGTGGATLTDPFLQVGDFYFLGVYGATESFTESANADAGYLAHGYALSNTNYDTQVLIRGLAGTTSVPYGVEAPYGGTLPATVNNTVIGDYWVKNHSQAAGAGTVVYLQGDSFDGRPDGLRMVLSSILNLSFQPSSREIARSSPSGYLATGHYSASDTWLMQGTFDQENINYGRYSPTYLSAADVSSFAFPPERGHLRGADLGAAGGADSDDCLNGALHTGGTKNECGAQLSGTVGSNTVAFQGVMEGAIDAAGTNFLSGWDTSEPYPFPFFPVVGVPNSLFLQGDNGLAPTPGGWSPPGATVNFDLQYRTIFTHLYSQIGGVGSVGLTPVSMSPSAGGGTIGALTNALFPQNLGSSVLACPSGGLTSATCITGTSYCTNACSSTPTTVTPGTIGAADVEGLLAVVNQSNGGCSPLLQDTCYQVNTPQVQCLDSCWSNCLDACVPIPSSTTTLPENTPPFNAAAATAGCQACGFSCAQSCNAGAAGCSGASCCGVDPTLDVQSFRETCYPSIGGIDHSTPVVVGAPSTTIQECLPGTGPSSVPAAACIDAACRPTVAYVGAADGMLHAIFLGAGPTVDALGNACSNVIRGASPPIEPGQELWAFMPNQNLPILHTGGDCTRSLFVDGVPVVKDVYANLTGNVANAPSWHTILTETLGQGGNHAFALDVTDPLLPIRTSGVAAAYWTVGGQITTFPAITAASPFILWEEGDPLDMQDYQPYYDPATGQLTWRGPLAVGGVTTAAEFADSPTEGPGFKASGSHYGGGASRNFNHYLGGSATVFMGNLVGSGAQQSVTYLAGQNVSPAADSHAGQITLFPCGGATCNQKDFASGGTSTNLGIAVAPPASQQYGPAGEVAYAFDSATGVPRSDPLSSGLPAVDHFAMLYLQSTNRSNGNDDIPTPLLGVSTTGKPETDLLVVPDLDGQVWGLTPTSMASSVTSGVGAAAIPFPLFDIDHYWGGPRFGAGGPAPASLGTVKSLVSQAAFGNPAVLLPPGACPGTGNGSNDAVVILASGGVDWGPEASLVVPLDVSVNDFQAGATGVLEAGYNGGAAELLPIAGGAVGATYSVQVPTCESAILSADGVCAGRVFGQPLVIGSSVYFNTNTGLLTGSGSSLDQTNGDGTISTLGNSSCTAATAQTNCNICQTSESSVDLLANVGKMASGLTAIAGTGGNIQIFGASTTGVSHLVGQAPTSIAQNLFQRLALQQWWLRPQRPTCPNAGDPSCSH